jgi:hypothetical protein
VWLFRRVSGAKTQKTAQKRCFWAKNGVFWRFLGDEARS